MSSSLAVRMMEWDNEWKKQRSTKPRKTREKKTTWAIEPDVPGLLDQVLDVDLNAERKLRSGKVVAVDAVPPQPKSDKKQSDEECKSNNDHQTSSLPSSAPRSSSKLPPLQIPTHKVHREHLRHNIYKKLGSKGLKPVEEDIELSDMSGSDSSSSSDSDGTDA